MQHYIMVDSSIPVQHHAATLILKKDDLHSLLLTRHSKSHSVLWRNIHTWNAVVREQMNSIIYKCKKKTTPFNKPHVDRKDIMVNDIIEILNSFDCTIMQIWLFCLFLYKQNTSSEKEKHLTFKVVAKYII